MRISAKADYALRAMMVISRGDGAPVSSEVIVNSENIPRRFLHALLSELRRANLLVSQRGKDPGYKLGRPAREISAADVIRVMDGPLTSVRGLCPEDTEYPDESRICQVMWVALRANIRLVLEEVSIADLASESLPVGIKALTDDPAAWISYSERPAAGTADPVLVPPARIGEGT